MADAERVLTERELNRAVLARQGLLEPSSRAIAPTLRAIGGLQAQYAPSMYVGLWSRMAGLERRADAWAGVAQRRAGDAHAHDDPPRGQARLLAVRAGGARGTP